MINEGLTEIFKVKGKAQLPKIQQTFFNDYTFLPSGPQWDKGRGDPSC